MNATELSELKIPNANKRTLKQRCLRGLRYLSIAFIAFAVIVAIRQLYHWRNLQQAIAILEATGEPMDGEQLNAYYAIPDGTQDNTKDWLEVIQDIEARHEQTCVKLYNKHVPMRGQPGGRKPYHEFLAELFFIPEFSASWEFRAAAQDYLHEFSKERVRLHAIASQHGAVRYPCDFTKGDATAQPHLIQLKLASNLLRLENREYVALGEINAALASVITMCAVDETLRREPNYISYLCRQTFLRSTCWHAQQSLQHLKLNNAQLQELQTCLASIELHAALQLAFLGERAIGLQTWQSAEILNELSDNKYASLGGKLMIPTGSLTSSRPGDCLKMLNILTELREASKLPFPERNKQCLEIKENLYSFLESEEYWPFYDRHLLTKLLISSNTRAYTFNANAIVEQRAMLLALGIERFRLQQNRYPQSLLEIEPFISPDWQLDPYSGQSLLYKQQEDSYILYSVGENSTDDLGNIEDGKYTNTLRSPDIGVKFKMKSVSQQ